ncbi:MAG: hypothetical protein CL931_17420 [Deltaproteobacteria bacterium]|nr:hypothetical protein [Deltaproteobacteria bacterium]
MRIESGSERGSFGAAVDARLEGTDALTRRIYNGVRGSYGGNFGTVDLEDIDLEEGRKTSGFDGSD